jgi:dipeptidyl aminopeptidase/acylaminoacyl peptidase
MSTPGDLGSREPDSNASKNSNNPPCGAWPSPLDSTILSQRIRLEDVQFDSDGQSLLWLEGRSGRNVLVLSRPGEARRDLTASLEPRGGVGYGGGEFTVHNGQVVFAARDGRLYSRGTGRQLPQPISPSFGACASPALSPAGNRLLYVHTDQKTDLLAMLDTRGSVWPVQAASGADFYMQPAWHPGGEFVAWVEWDHPNMPWDGARLMLARVVPGLSALQDIRHIAGDADSIACQPRFSPDGRWLSYLASDGEWEKLVLRDLASGDERALLHGDQCLISQPAWGQGMRACGWSGSSKRLYTIRHYAGRSGIWQVGLDGKARKLDTSPYTWHAQLSVSPVDDRLAFIASAPDIPERVVLLDSLGLQVVARSDGENLPEGYYPEPQEIDWVAPDGSTVHGFYFPPASPDFQPDGLPPAIVHIHGGPTSIAPLRYTPEALFFTSRGYGWLEVNYRGSSGYGRSYLRALDGGWGELDVEDAVGGANALSEHGLADPRRMVIHGSSAGGFTVLNTLARHPGIFKAGVCLYGISDLFSLILDTHKFEAHYNDRLVGVLPRDASRYQERSAIYHADRITDALALFQGSADPVVPPAQAQGIAESLKRRGIPHIYKVYEGEGHGFRRSDTLADYLASLERFLLERVVFSP